MTDSSSPQLLLAFRRKRQVSLGESLLEEIEENLFRVELGRPFQRSASRENFLKLRGNTDSVGALIDKKRPVLSREDNYKFFHQFYVQAQMAIKNWGIDSKKVLDPIIFSLRQDLKFEQKLMIWQRGLAQQMIFISILFLIFYICSSLIMELPVNWWALLILFIWFFLGPSFIYIFFHILQKKTFFRWYLWGECALRLQQGLLSKHSMKMTLENCRWREVILTSCTRSNQFEKRLIFLRARLAEIIKWWGHGRAETLNDIDYWLKSYWQEIELIQLHFIKQAELLSMVLSAVLVIPALFFMMTILVSDHLINL